jgi:LysM repeat protein
MDMEPEIAEMHNIICKPTITAAQMMNGRIEIEGTAEMHLLYTSNESGNKLRCTKQEFSFRHDIPVENENAANCDVDIDNSHCNYNLVSAKEVEVKLAITFKAKVIKPVSIPIITAANESPLDTPAASPSIISLYFVQPGDSLWDIAKRYRVPMVEILLVNGLEEGFSVYPGMQLLIPRRRRDYRY